MFVKKSAFFGGIFAILALALGACSFKTIVFDDSHPIEQSSTIWFGEGLVIKSYNGIPVQTRGSFKTAAWGYISEWRLKNVVLPSGEIEFGLDVATNNRSYIIYRVEDVSFKYKFEPGLVYSLVFTAYGGIDKKTWGVMIYQARPNMSARFKKEEFVAFVPFKK